MIPPVAQAFIRRGFAKIFEELAIDDFELTVADSADRPGILSTIRRSPLGYFVTPIGPYKFSSFVPILGFQAGYVIL